MTNIVPSRERDEPFALAPVQPVAEFEKRLAELRDFIKRNMKDTVDYGHIPGVSKPTLFKPGAEKLLRWHGLVVDIRILPSSKTDLAGTILDYDFEAVVRHAASDTVLGTVHANINSEERRYKNARQQKQDKDGKPVGEPQTIADQKNTLVKMGDKRILTSAALLYTMGSEAFTQDVEETGTTEARESASKTANCPKCGKGTLIERHRKSDGAAFWACDAGSYDPKTKKRTGCDHIQNEPPAADTPEGQTPEQIVEKFTQRKRLLVEYDKRGFLKKDDFLPPALDSKLAEKIAWMEDPKLIAAMEEAAQLAADEADRKERD